MGFSISWIAFRGKGKDDVLATIGLVDTGVIDEANEAPVSGAVLPTCWYVVYFNDYSYVAAERLSRLSAGCMVVACQLEEHVMASAVYVYEDGVKRCFVSHESERGRYDLSVDGDPPEVFPALRDGLLRQQDRDGGSEASVDYVFDIPLQLAAALCGYRHDRWKFDWGEPLFSRLERVKA